MHAVDKATDLNELGFGERFTDELCKKLENATMFKDFSRLELENIVRYMHAYKSSKGAILLQEGETDHYLMIIIQGKAGIYKENDQGQRKKIATVRNGATLGEMSIIDAAPHSATVITEESCEIALLTKTNLQKITDEQPALGVKLLWKIAWQLSVRLRQVSGVLVEHIE